MSDSKTQTKMALPKKKLSCCWDLPNAPFITAWEDNLTFFQLQMIFAYINAHNEEVNHENIHKNAFTSKDDASILDRKNKKPALTADLFWKCVYQATFWQLLSEYCKPGSTAYYYLSSVSPSAEFLYQEMLNWFAPSEGSIFGRFPELTEISELNSFITPISMWVWNIRYGKKPLYPGWYAPLLDKPVLVPILLLTVFLLFEKQVKSMVDLNHRIYVDKGYLIAELSDVNGSSSSPSYKIFITHRDRVFSENEKVRLPKTFTQKNLVQLVIDNGLVKATKKRIKGYTRQTKNLPQKITIITAYQVPFLELLKQDGEVPNSVEMSKPIFNKAIRETAILVDQNRKRLRNRAKLI